MLSRFVPNLDEYLQTAGYVLIGLCLFGGGFYFGGKVTGAKQVEQTDYDTAIQQIALTSVVEDAVHNTIPATAAEPVPGVYWLPVNQPPVCPETHPLKGKFDSAVNVYYTPDNKSYDRVKPHLCLSDEDFAQNEAGFIKKF